MFPEEVPTDRTRTDAAARFGSECSAVSNWRDTMAMAKSDCLRMAALCAEGWPAATKKAGRSCLNR